MEIQPVLFFPRDNYGRYLHPSWRQHGIAIQEWRERIIFKVEQWAVASSREDRTVALKNGFAGGSWDYRAYRGGTFANVYNELEHVRWEHDWEYSLCDGNWHSHFDDDGNVVEGGWFGPDSVSMCASWMHALLTTNPPGITAKRQSWSDYDLLDAFLLPPVGPVKKIKEWMEDKGYQGAVERGYRPDELCEFEEKEDQELGQQQEEVTTSELPKKVYRWPRRSISGHLMIITPRARNSPSTVAEIPRPFAEMASGYPTVDLRLFYRAHQEVRSSTGSPS